jgi:hypothetical protein
MKKAMSTVKVFLGLSDLERLLFKKQIAQPSSLLSCAQKDMMKKVDTLILKEPMAFSHFPKESMEVYQQWSYYAKYIGGY